MTDLESMVKRVLAAGYSAGHADDFEMLCGECVMNLEHQADLVNNLIDAIENFQCSGGLSIAIKGSIEAIRGEE